MNPVRKQRLLITLAGTLIVGVAVTLILYALGQNINAFYSPSDLFAKEISPDQVIRIGGMVEEGSVVHDSNQLLVTFTLADDQHDVLVQYAGLLPDLFREGQGIVAQGHLSPQGVFIASEVLAKHDSTYMPADINSDF